MASVDLGKELPKISFGPSIPAALSVIGDDDEEITPLPSYMVKPVDAAEEKKLAKTERIREINRYFEWCATHKRQPRLTGLALAAGYAGVAAMRRDAQRIPELRYAIGRAFTAVAAAYEEHIEPGVNCSAALFIMKNVPDFDPADASYSPPSYSFKERGEIEVKVHGVHSAEDEGKDLSPREAYLQLIKNRVIETEPVETIETQQTDDGVFVSVELPIDE